MNNFYSISLVMYLICAGISIPALTFIYIDRFYGLKKSDSKYLNSGNSSIRFIHENITSFQETKDLGGGFIAFPTIDTSQGIIAQITKISPRYKFLSWLCSSECSGVEQRNSILYEGNSYFIYQEVDTKSENKINVIADIFYLNSGKIDNKIPINNIPLILQKLNDQQLYGLDPLPSGVQRIDSSWIAQSNLPSKILRVNEGCIEIGLSILIVNFIFGGNLILSVLLKNIIFNQQS